MMLPLVLAGTAHLDPGRVGGPGLQGGSDDFWLQMGSRSPVRFGDLGADGAVKSKQPRMLWFCEGLRARLPTGS